MVSSASHCLFGGRVPLCVLTAGGQSQCVGTLTCLLKVTGCQPSTRLMKGTSVKVKVVSMVAKYAQVPAQQVRVVMK